ncbi:polysaccharide deacetylase family protein [Alkalihalobacillus oceani]|uniref:Polysaccharide deacetylase family protein n=1 Tax=Halalkalibacter oceani TaxID=1653776 RepID=A0A9X2DQA0_9BACI|nr:polysaccharide deacetylase family protein [Halalkalibacter oceani]
MDHVSHKLIEFLDLQDEKSTYFVKVRTMMKKTMVYLELEIDEETYRHMNQIVQRGKNARYRLSLQAMWDPFRREYLSTITRSEGTSLTSYDFVCSKKYVEVLEQLNTIHTIKKSDFKSLTYIHQLDKQGNKKKERRTLSSVFPQRMSSKFMKPVVAIASVILLLFLSMNNIFININVFTNSEHEKPIVDVSSEIQKQANSAHAQEPEEGTNTAGKETSEEEKVAEQAEAKTEKFHIQSDIVYGLPEGYAALTFDDGPSAYTKEIVNVLQEHGVKATFFFVGRNALRFSDSVTYVKEHDMAIGVHSWSHEDLTTLSSDNQMKDFIATNEVVTSILKENVGLFRPPYGNIDEALQKNAQEAGLNLVMWNRDPRDWQKESAEEVLQYFRDAELSGGIFLLHERSHTLEALPDIIDYFKSNNIKLVTLH